MNLATYVEIAEVIVCSNDNDSFGMDNIQA